MKKRGQSFNPFRSQKISSAECEHLKGGRKAIDLLENSHQIVIDEILDVKETRPDEGYSTIERRAVKFDLSLIRFFGR